MDCLDFKSPSHDLYDQTFYLRIRNCPLPNLSWSHFIQQLIVVMDYTRGSSCGSSDSNCSTSSNPDSVIGILGDLPFSVNTAHNAPAEAEGRNFIKIQLPKLFSSITASAARLNPFLNSHVSTAAEEWIRRFV